MTAPARTLVASYLKKIDDYVETMPHALGLTDEKQREALALLSGLQLILFPEHTARPTDWCAGRTTESL